MNSREKKPGVFKRLAEDISNWNTKSDIYRSNQNGAGAITHPKQTKLSKANTELMTMSNSNLGKAILYGNVSQQRHLDLKLVEIEKQRLLRMRNMEWKQIVTFRQLVKDNKRRSRSKDKLSSRSGVSVTSQSSSVRLPKIHDERKNETAEELENKVKAWKRDMRRTYGR